MSASTRWSQGNYKQAMRPFASGRCVALPHVASAVTLSVVSFILLSMSSLSFFGLGAPLHSGSISFRLFEATTPGSTLSGSGSSNSNETPSGEELNTGSSP